MVRTRASWCAAATSVLMALTLTACSSLNNVFSDPGERMRARAEDDARAQAEADPLQVPKRSFEEELAEGDRQRESGSLTKALWSYMTAHKEKPEAGGPRLRIAFLKLERDPALSETLFLDLLREGHESPAVWGGLALSRRALGKRSEARRAAERARQLDPLDPVFVTLLGTILDDLGEHEKAQALYVEALELRPADSRLMNNLGMSELLSGKAESALSTFQRALLLEPRNPALHNNVGLALGHLERYEEAIEHFRQGGPEGAALNNLGFVYFLNERYDDAIRSYERALDAQGADKLRVLRNLEAAHLEKLAREPETDPLPGYDGIGDGAAAPAAP